MVLTALLILIVFLVGFLFLAWYMGRKVHIKEQGIDLSNQFKNKINTGKIVQINDLKFKIRKINILDYLEGAKVLAESFSTFQKSTNKGGQEESLEALNTVNLNKLKKYLTDIICAGCLEPKFVRSEKDLDESSILIEELFSDWVLAQSLAQEIFEYTYGKKK